MPPLWLANGCGMVSKAISDSGSATLGSPADTWYSAITEAPSGWRAYWTKNRRFVRYWGWNVRPSSPCSPPKSTFDEMSRNTVGAPAPGWSTLITPPCSTTKSRLLPSCALVTRTGVDRPLRTLTRPIGGAAASREDTALPRTEITVIARPPSERTITYIRPRLARDGGCERTPHAVESSGPAG